MAQELYDEMEPGKPMPKGIDIRWAGHDPGMIWRFYAFQQYGMEYKEKEWEETEIAKSSLFGFLIILGMYIEIDNNKCDKVIDGLKRIKSDLLDQVEMILRLRCGQGTGEILRDKFKVYGLSSEEEDLLWKWSHRKVDFVKK